MSFYTAARDGQVDLLKHHLQNGADVHQRFNNDRTALHFACDGGNVEVVKILLASQADVNQPDMFNKDTPLHLASEAGHTEVVRILLENGGNVNAQDQMNGETPLHLACEAGFSDIIQLLLHHGADTTIENVYKKQALHYADAATQEAMQRQGATAPQTPHDGEENAHSHAEPMPANRPNVFEGASITESEELLDVGEVEDDDLIQALEDAGPSRAQQTHEGESWFAVHSIAGRSSDGRDKQNQDAFLISHALGGDAQVSLFGVFDGHGRNGHLVSYFAKSVLPGILSREIAGIRAGAMEEQESSDAAASRKAVVSSGKVASILSDACVTLQRMLEQQDKFDCQSSGSTAIFSLIAYGTVYVANVGDSRALLAHVTGRQPAPVHDREKLFVVPMSIDQVPNVREEKARVEQSGGVVRRDEDSLTGEQGPFRVWRKDLAGPGLAMSRSIGDAAAHQIGVSALPVVMQYKLSDADRLLIIATDGVWDMLDNSEVVDIAARASGDCKGDPAYASAQVCQTARRAWEFKETRVDDITCLLVFLQHWRESASVPPVTDSVSTSPSQEIYQAYGRPTAGGDASYTSMGACAQESPSYTPLSRQDAPEAYSAEKREQLANSQAAQASGQVSYMALSRDAYSRGQEPAPSYHTIQPGEQTQNADKSYTHHHWPPAPASHEFGASSYRPWMAPEGRGAQQPPPATGERGADMSYSVGRSGGGQQGQPYFHQGQADVGHGPSRAPPTTQPYAGARAQHEGQRLPKQPNDDFFGLSSLGNASTKEGDADCSIQ